MMTKVKYLLLAHPLYNLRIQSLKEQLKKLKVSLPPEVYKQHEIVKMASRLYKATFDIIPEDPSCPEYFLKGQLKKFRQYKQGLKRYRLFFTFSQSPPIIIYLYINDEKHLRKEGSKNDPYEQFLKLVNSGVITHETQDPKMQKMLHELISPSS